MRHVRKEKNLSHTNDEYIVYIIYVYYNIGIQIAFGIPNKYMVEKKQGFLIEMYYLFDFGGLNYIFEG